MKAISGKRMCRLLKDRGWVLVRTRGSHFAFEHPNRAQTIVVPVHGSRDLKPGTQRGIMKMAGLTAAEL